MTGIDRYTTPQMESLWSDQAKYEVWADVEQAAAQAQGAPGPVLDSMASAPVPDPEDVARREKRTRHDVVAFLDCWRGGMTDEAAGWVHRNMTSSDLVDTANALLLRRAGRTVLLSLMTLRRNLARHALRHRDTIRVGRTHGQWAEVTTWGYRVADLAEGVERACDRLQAAVDAVSVAKLSGPVGDYKRITREQERKFTRLLGLNAPHTATQVVMRDAYADLIHACAQACNVIEAFAMEVRLGQRSEVGELAEGFGAGQRGSSAMPHKRNPIASERLCGLARLVRAQVVPVMEGVALHHERDISHSSVERVALPTALTLTHFAVRDAASLLRNLVVDAKQMYSNAEKAGRVAVSAAVKDLLVDAGVSPDTAWRAVQAEATRSRRAGRGPWAGLGDRLTDEGVAESVIDEVDEDKLRELAERPLAGQLTGDLDHVWRRMTTLAQAR